MSRDLEDKLTLLILIVGLIVMLLLAVGLTVLITVVTVQLMTGQVRLA